jgi:hypothetical protein
MKFVLAVLSICYGGECETHTLKVESKACSLGTIHVQHTHAGSWVPATLNISCK